MRSERGALPALVIVLALVALFAVVAYVLFTGEGLDDAGSADAEALAMSSEEAVAEEPVAGRSTASEREASAEELLPDESLADAAEEDPDAIPEDATGVTGTVVDRTGRPAAGVEVVVGRGVTRQQAAEFGVTIPPSELAGRFERRATTDESGRFTAIELIPKDGYRIEIETDEGQIGRKDGITVIDALLQEIGDIPLRPGARVRGKVRTDGGAPVAGARVEFGWDWGSEPIVTDARGRFDAGVLFPGRHQVRVSAEGYALADTIQREFVEGDDVDDLELIMVQAAPIRGRIVDEAGRGVADAWVNANRQGRTMFSWFHDQTQSAADGTFEFLSIPAGEYDLNAGKVGYRYANEGGVVAGGPPVELALKKAGRIEGVVLDASTGSPVKAETVRLLWIPPWRRDDPNAELEPFYSDAPADQGEDGSFSIGLDDGGTFVVEALADGYSPGRSERFDLEENGVVTGIVVRVEKGRSLELNAIDAATREPVARAILDIHTKGDSEGDGSATLVQLGYIGNGSTFHHVTSGGGAALGERVARVVTDEAGQATCRSIFPGSFVVVARKHGFAPARVDGIVVARGSAPSPVEVPFSHGGTIAGTVTNDRGVPEPALKVIASRSDGETTEAVSGEGGVYRIENLAPGRYAVEAENPDERSSHRAVFDSQNWGGEEKSEAERFPLVVEEGGTVTSDLVIARVTPGQLAGTVLVNGAPRPDVQVMANAIQPDGQVSWDWGNASRTDEFGRFKFRRLAPGTYGLLVHETWSNMFEGGNATVTAGSETLLTLDIGLGSITGIVVDAEGRPLEGVQVRSQRSRPEKQRFFFGGAKQMITGADGSFRIDDVQDGTHALTFRKEGFVTRTDAEVAVAPRRDASQGRVELTTGGWIRLTVARGKENDRVRVSGQLPGTSQQRHQWLRLDDRGSSWFEVGDLEGTGTLTVTERGENPRSTTVQVTLTKGSVAEATVSFD